MTEEQVMWDLPLSRGMAYWHHALLVAGNTMEFPDDEDADAGIAGAKKILQAFREKNKSVDNPCRLWRRQELEQD